MREDLTLGDPGAVVLYSLSLKEQINDDFCQDMTSAVLQGGIFPLPLAGDNPTNVRLIFNEALLEQEEAEWIGKYEWQLRIPDGQLMLDGGCDADELDENLLGDLYHLIEIPPGDYGLTAYVYITSPNAIDCLEVAGLKERWLDWFNRTRSGIDAPAWLLEREDYEQYRRLSVVERNRAYVDFLIHLTPLKTTPPPLPELIDQGWLPYTHNARIPNRCPLGLPFEADIETDGSQLAFDDTYQPDPSSIKAFDLDALDISNDEDNYRQMIKGYMEDLRQEMGGEFEPAYVQSLFDKLGAMYPDEQYEAAVRLWTIGQPVLPQLLEIAQTHQNPDMRDGAIWALGEFDDETALNVVSQAATNKDEVEKVRVKAILVLGEKNTHQALETLTMVLTDGNWWLRHCAVQALTKNKHPERIELFTATLSDPSQPVQEAAANALKKIGTAKAMAALDNWQPDRE
ncbi:MAG: HEAT repeat domain-containing protein [Anaerolineae bacterium]|nr:HEAT repeat domain-containing protein [Anaerolineae bacterium]